MNSTTVEPSEGTHRIVGVTLAIVSGFFIGSSFIFKKRGLLDTNALGHAPAKGHAYLKSPMWWLGMTLMIFGEGANFLAYAFSPAILVTPLGALSVVISAILSSIFLNEKLNFSGKVGCAQSLFGALIIVFNASGEGSTETVREFFYYVVAPGFIVYSILVLAVVVYLIYYAAPQYGNEQPIVYISICSLVGSYLVLSTQGFGSSLIYTFGHWNEDNQLLDYRIYLLLVFIIVTVMLQINYLNKALNLFSTAIVTPVYYVFFTTATLVSSAILFRGFPVATPIAGISILIGFFVIVGGVSLLFQYSTKITKLNALNKNMPASGGKGLLKPEEIDDDDDVEHLFADQNGGKRASLKSEQIELSDVSLNVMKQTNRERASTAPVGVWNIISSKFQKVGLGSSKGYNKFGSTDNLDAFSPEIGTKEMKNTTGRAAMGLDSSSPQNYSWTNIATKNPLDSKLIADEEALRPNQVTGLSQKQSTIATPKTEFSHKREHSGNVPKVRLAPQGDKKPPTEIKSSEKLPILPPPPKHVAEVGSPNDRRSDLADTPGYVNVGLGEKEGNPW